VVVRNHCFDTALTIPVVNTFIYKNLIVRNAEYLETLSHIPTDEIPNVVS
jgi:hypothetical protein